VIQACVELTQFLANPTRGQPNHRKGPGGILPFGNGPQSNDFAQFSPERKCLYSSIRDHEETLTRLAWTVFNPGLERIGDPALNNLRLLLRGWRQQAVEAEVHGGGAVMIGPVVGEGDQCESPRRFAAAPDLNRIAQRGVRYFRHRSIAEVE
jgi:hypothetical protein